MNSKKAKMLRREAKKEMSANRDAPVEDLVAANQRVIHHPYSHVAFYNALKRAYKKAQGNGLI